MADNIEVGNLVARISFDDTGLSKSMAAIDRQMKLVKSEFDKTASSLKNYGATEDQLKAKSEALNQQMQLQQQKINKVNEAFQESVEKKGLDAKETQRLATELNKAQTVYNNLEGDLKDVNTQLANQPAQLSKAQQGWKDLGQALENAGSKIKSVGESVTKAGKDLSMKVTAPIVALGALSVKSSIEFESAFAGIRKTVSATEEQFAELEQGVRDMSKVMPASAAEIAAVGEAAGQLGIKTDNLLSFTEVMIGLGEATTMSSDQAATELARLANITKMNQADFDKLGSSIVALGNNFATTEGDITSMAMRLAGAGSQVGMSEADILGLAAALSSVGIEAEMGGSAMSRVMVNMQVAASTGMTKVQKVVAETGISLRDMQLMASNASMDFADLSQSLGMTKQELKNIIDAGVDLGNFSKIAGMTSDEFKQAFEKDAVGALGAFINGLGNAESSGESAINMLEEMGISEIRLRDSLLRAGGANELFAESIELSNKAWEENTALQNEVAQRYATTESQLAMFKNTMTDLGITLGNIIIPAIMKVVEVVTPWIEKFAALDQSTQQVILVIGGIAAAIGPVLVVVGTLISSIGTIVTAIGSLSGVMAVFTSGTAAAAAGGTAAAGGATAAGGALAALTGPIGIAIAAIAGLVAAFVVLYKNNEDFRTATNKIWTDIKNSFMDAWNAIVSFIKPLIEDVKKFFSEQLGQIKEFWDEHGEAIMKIVKVAIEFITGFVKVQMAGLKTIISVAWELIKGVITIAWEGIKLVISNALDTVIGVLNIAMKLFKGDWKGAWEEVKKLAAEIWGNIETFFKNVDLVQIGKDIINGLIKGIGSMVTAVTDTVKDVAKSIGDAVTNFFGIKSPSRLMMGYGDNISEGLAIGIEKGGKGATNAADNVSQAVDKKFNATMQKIITQANNAAKGVKKKTTQISKSFNEAFAAITSEKKLGNLDNSQYIKALEMVDSRYAKTAEQHRKINEAMSATNKAIAKEQQELAKKAFESSEKYINAKKEANELSLTQELVAWERVQSRYLEGTAEREEADKNVLRVRKEIYTELTTASDTFLAKTKEINASLEAEEKRLNEVYQQSVADRAKSISSFAGLFDLVSFDTDTTGTDLLTNLESQVDYLDTWATEIQRLAARGIDEGLLEELRSLGPKAGPEIAALNTLTNEELSKYSNLWKTKSEASRKVAVKELEGLRLDTQTQLSKLRTESATKLEEVKAEFNKTVTEIRYGAAEEFKGLKDDMPALGKNAVQGLIDGLVAMEGPLKKQAEKLANSVSSTIRKALDIHSPSRVMMQLGEFTGQGFAQGIKATSIDVAKSSNKLSATAVNGASTGSSSKPAQNIFNFEGLMKGATNVVRNDGDIKALARETAKEIFNMTQITMRGAGVR